MDSFHKKLEEITPRTALRRNLQALEPQETPPILKSQRKTRFIQRGKKRDEEILKRLSQGKRDKSKAQQKSFKDEETMSPNVSNIRGADLTYGNLGMSEESSIDESINLQVTTKLRGFRDKRRKELSLMPETKSNKEEEMLSPNISKVKGLDMTYANVGMSDESSINESINLQVATKLRKFGDKRRKALMVETKSPIIGKRKSFGMLGKGEAGVLKKDQTHVDTTDDSLYEDTLANAKKRRSRHRKSLSRIELTQEGVKSVEKSQSNKDIAEALQLHENVRKKRSASLKVSEDTYSDLSDIDTSSGSISKEKAVTLAAKKSRHQHNALSNQNIDLSGSAEHLSPLKDQNENDTENVGDKFNKKGINRVVEDSYSLNDLDDSLGGIQNLNKLKNTRKAPPIELSFSSILSKLEAKSAIRTQDNEELHQVGSQSKDPEIDEMERVAKTVGETQDEGRLQEEGNQSEIPEMEESERLSQQLEESVDKQISFNNTVNPVTPPQLFRDSEQSESPDHSQAGEAVASKNTVYEESDMSVPVFSSDSNDSIVSSNISAALVTLYDGVSSVVRKSGVSPTQAQVTTHGVLSQNDIDDEGSFNTSGKNLENGLRRNPRKNIHNINENSQTRHAVSPQKNAPKESPTKELKLSLIRIDQQKGMKTTNDPVTPEKENSSFVKPSSSVDNSPQKRIGESPRKSSPQKRPNDLPMKTSPQKKMRLSPEVVSPLKGIQESPRTPSPPGDMRASSRTPSPQKGIRSSPRIASIQKGMIAIPRRRLKEMNIDPVKASPGKGFQASPRKPSPPKGIIVLSRTTSPQKASQGSPRITSLQKDTIASPRRASPRKSMNGSLREVTLSKGGSPMNTSKKGMDIFPKTSTSPNIKDMIGTSEKSMGKDNRISRTGHESLEITSKIKTASEMNRLDSMSIAHVASAEEFTEVTMKLNLSESTSENEDTEMKDDLEAASTDRNSQQHPAVETMGETVAGGLSGTQSHHKSFAGDNSMELDMSENGMASQVMGQEMSSTKESRFSLTGDASDKRDDLGRIGLTNSLKKSGETVAKRKKSTALLDREESFMGEREKQDIVYEKRRSSHSVGRRSLSEGEMGLTSIVHEVQVHPEEAIKAMRKFNFSGNSSIYREDVTHKEVEGQRESSTEFKSVSQSGIVEARIAEVEKEMCRDTDVEDNSVVKSIDFEDREESVDSRTNNREGERGKDALSEVENRGEKADDVSEKNDFALSAVSVETEVSTLPSNDYVEGEGDKDHGDFTNTGTLEFEHKKDALSDINRHDTESLEAQNIGVIGGSDVLLKESGDLNSVSLEKNILVQDVNAIDREETRVKLPPINSDELANETSYVRDISDENSPVSSRSGDVVAGTTSLNNLSNLTASSAFQRDGQEEVDEMSIDNDVKSSEYQVRKFAVDTELEEYSSDEDPSLNLIPSTIQRISEKPVNVKYAMAEMHASPEGEVLSFPQQPAETSTVVPSTSEQPTGTPRLVQTTMRNFLTKLAAQPPRQSALYDVKEAERFVDKVFNRMESKKGRNPAVTKRPVPKQRGKELLPLSLPESTTKEIFEHYAKCKVDKKAWKAIFKASEKFWQNASEDIVSISQEKDISKEHVIRLMTREGTLNETISLSALVEEYLPSDLRDILIPTQYAHGIVHPPLEN